MARRKCVEETVTLRTPVLHVPRPQSKKPSHTFRLSPKTWAHLGQIVRDGDAKDRTQALEQLVAEHEEGHHRDLRLRFSKASDLKDFLRFCARHGDLPATWLSRKIKEAMDAECSE